MKVINEFNKSDNKTDFFKKHFKVERFIIDRGFRYQGAVIVIRDTKTYINTVTGSIVKNGKVEEFVNPYDLKEISNFIEYNVFVGE